MITKFKIFESTEELKKYVLLMIDDKLSIIEIRDSFIADIGKMFYFRTLYRLKENGIINGTFSDKNVLLKLRYSFIIKNAIDQSNNLEELINKMKIIYDSNKYNL